MKNLVTQELSQICIKPELSLTNVPVKYKNNVARSYIYKIMDILAENNFLEILEEEKHTITSK